jgi:hypothetical protein
MTRHISLVVLSALTLLSLLLCLTPTLAQSTRLLVGEGGCSASTPDSSTSFNLARLQSRSKGYSANDHHLVKHNETLVQDEPRYTYKFNVCRDSPAPNATLCDHAAAPAWQLRPAQPATGPWVITSCVRLSNNQSNSEWSLLDSTDPSRGVSVTYFDGETCHKGSKDPAKPETPRRFRLNFICADTDKIEDQGDGSSGNEIEAAVREDTACFYEIEFVSRYACPTQCPTSSSENGLQLMCNGGYCGYDSHIGASRCFCQRGFYGADCSATSVPSSTCTGLCLFLVFTIVLLVILLVIGSLVYWKLTRIVANQRTMGLSQKRDRDNERSSSRAQEESGNGAGRMGPDGTTEENDEPSIHVPSGASSHPKQHHTSSQQQQNLHEVDLDLDDEELEEDLRDM